MDVLDCIEGGLLVPENLGAEAAEPVGEESQAASKHLSCAISCADKDTVEDVEVETPADDEQSTPPVEVMYRVDRE